MEIISLIAQAENNQEIVAWLNTTFKAAIKKDPTITQENCEHIIDYLKSSKAPKRLRKMSYKQAYRKADEWTKALQKKGAHIVETEEDIKVIYTWKSGMRLVRLVGENAFKREGYLMRHCVASYYGDSSLTIYSLRDSNNDPHCTIEVMEDVEHIQQIKGKGNGPIHPKYVEYVIDSLERLGKTVYEPELKYLGYKPCSEDYWRMLDCCFKDVKSLSFKGKRYLYAGSKHTLCVSKKQAIKFTQNMYEE